MINKLLLAYLIGLVVTSTFIFIFSEEKVTYRLFATIITGLTWPLSLILDLPLYFQTPVIT
ncbi:GhoT/OrtT family toxin [Escherichia coli]|uniref:GhoT/OrtT family toxin n=1 Tax=Escherichia coli TaxID=562 RepID=UPI001F1DA602|nr:GhoT/OrtT family toxin [Escherichia coli]